jgi:hypothetical protein
MGNKFRVFVEGDKMYMVDVDNGQWYTTTPVQYEKIPEKDRLAMLEHLFKKQGGK